VPGEGQENKNRKRIFNRNMNGTSLLRSLKEDNKGVTEDLRIGTEKIKKRTGRRQGDPEK